MSLKVVFLLSLVAMVCAKGFSPHSCACAKIYMPLCASNMMTYNNMCEYQCVARQYQEMYHKELRVLHQGRCDGKD